MSTATYFFVKTDFGTMQCTPLRMSTTIETRQSPTIEAAIHRPGVPPLHVYSPAGYGRPT